MSSMEFETIRPIRKRLRSDESPCSAIQTKIFINQRILDKHDNDKMKAIQAKTVRQLFEAARQNNPPKITNKTPLSQQIILYGDGRINFRNNEIPMDLPVEPRKAECCHGKQSFLQEKCINCNMDLCEECGFSCTDCGSFLCRCCVTIFDCGTSEEPICEKCALFK